MQFQIFFILLTLLSMAALRLEAQSFKGLPQGNERIASSNKSEEQKLLELVNELRQTRGLAALSWSKELSWAARYHAKDMIIDGYFEHGLYDRKGRKLKKVADTFEKIKPFCQTELFPMAENIAVGTATAAAVFELWYNSPGHLKNMLDPDARFMGAGFVADEDSEWGYYWAQIFGQ
ncbi:CAP domain-containing protein [Saprospira grandis]|uniref:CAP domain-containing protein n=1 Tax=Saprospira grandis TaxID=1008 RepID=UPI0022DCFBD2|nr:CAP domain-containing protein [Saprospira grandis]WBM75569.1 CAP domain-containing protein [Saprospira grandis]